MKESEILKALAHPVRLRMVEGLINNECNVNKIVDKLKLPQSTVSQHLSILRNKGIVEVRKEGLKTCYKVVNPKILELVKVLGKYSFSDK
jgi:ArsR family transcriptional regulator